MNDRIFQQVFDAISRFLPDRWSQVVFFAGYTEGSYSMKFYAREKDSPYTDCFHMPGATVPELIKTFAQIDGFIKNEKGIDSQPWTIFTMIVGEDGKMRADFEYEDHSQDMLTYEAQWKERYLSSPTVFG